MYPQLWRLFVAFHRPISGKNLLDCLLLKQPCNGQFRVCVEYLGCIWVLVGVNCQNLLNFQFHISEWSLSTELGYVVVHFWRAWLHVYLFTCPLIFPAFKFTAVCIVLNEPVLLTVVFVNYCHICAECTSVWEVLLFFKNII